MILNDFIPPPPPNKKSFYQTVCAGLEVFLVVQMSSTSIAGLFKGFCIGVFHLIPILTAPPSTTPSPPPKKKHTTKKIGVNSSFRHVLNARASCLVMYKCSSEMKNSSKRMTN